MAHAMTTREVIELLQRRNPDEFLLAEFWYAEDVQSLKDGVSDDEAQEVLIYASKRFDANVGINWDFLTFMLEVY